MLDGMVLGALWFGVFALAHVTTFHLRRIEQRTRVVTLLYAVCLVACLLTTIVLRTDLSGSALPGVDYRLLNACVGLLTMGCLFVVYMPAYYVFATSQSVQAVVRLSRAPGGRLPVTDVVREATSDGMLRQRLDSMVVSGNLTRAGDRYVSTAKARRGSRIFDAIQRLWRLDPVG